MTRRGFTVAAASILTARAAERHQFTGIVLTVDPRGRTFVASCAAVPGYMPAMTMPFSVRAGKQLDGISPGQHVRFTLVTEGGRSYAEDIRANFQQNMEQESLRARRLQLLEGETAAAPVLPGGPVPDFTLTDQAGQKVSLSQFKGRVVAVTFIYTSCPLPDYCFRLSNNFGLIAKRFASRMPKELVLLSITFDPVHDSPAVLAKYGRTWNADANSWHFLTGPLPEVKRVCQTFGLNFWQDEGLLTHSLRTILVDRAGRLAANIQGNEVAAGQTGDYIAVLLG